MNANKIRTGWVFFFSAVLLLISCKEDHIDVYSGETNIYFSMKRWGSGENGYTYEVTKFPVGDVPYSDKWSTIREAQDSILVSMALDGTDEGERVQLIPVSISGNVADYDREIKFTIDDQITTAVEETDFNAEGFIPAGKAIGAVAVRLKRTSFKDTTLAVGIHLVPNEHFQTNYRVINRSSSDTTKVDMQSFKLVGTSILAPPPRWSYLVNYFGPFSRKKIYLVLEITGGDIEDMYTTNVIIPLMVGWGKALKNYLAEQKAKGNIIYEEDGVTEMTAGKDV